MNPVHVASVEVGPTLVVTWSMIAAILVGLVVLGLLLAWLLAYIVRGAIAANMTVLHTELKRVVAVAESVDGQYRPLKRQVEEVEATAKRALAATTRLEGDVEALKRRVGLPAT